MKKRLSGQRERKKKHYSVAFIWSMWNVCETCVSRVHLTLNAIKCLCCQCYQFTLHHSMVPSYKCVRTSYVIIIFIAFIDACDTHTVQFRLVAESTSQTVRSQWTKSIGGKRQKFWAKYILSTLFVMMFSSQTQLHYLHLRKWLKTRFFFDFIKIQIRHSFHSNNKKKKIKTHWRCTQNRLCEILSSTGCLCETLLLLLGFFIEIH